MSSDVMDLESIAAYLHLDSGTVHRLAERGRLPGRKVGGKWCFSRSEIHHWLESRIGASGEGELMQMEHALQRPPGAGKLEAISVADMLPLHAIAVPLEARTKASVMDEMVLLATHTGWVWEPDKLSVAVKEREEMHPTALDNGVALLHPRRPMASILGEPFLALGITPRGVPFGGSRGMLTDIFFLICSVEDRSHLRTLARLSRVINDAGLLGELRAAVDSRTVLDAILRREQQLTDESSA
jgi:PTS system nitrogen regulatory IIA component